MGNRKKVLPAEAPLKKPQRPTGIRTRKNAAKAAEAKETPEQRKARLTANKTKQEKLLMKNMICELWLKGYSYMYIRDALAAVKLIVSVATIGTYVKELLDDWKSERVSAIEEQKQLELMRIAKLEQTYWDAWERSIGITVSRNVNGWESDIDTSKLKVGINNIGLNQETNTVVTGNTAKAKAGRANKKYVNFSESVSLGDVRFLMGIERCIDKRCKICGLDAPLVVEDKTKTKVVRKINFAVYQAPKPNTEV